MLVIVNKEQQELNCSPGYPVLDLLRTDLQLTGTKAACREGDCGTCLILLGELDDELSLSYQAVNSCLLPTAAVEGRHVVTIEGLADREPNPLSNLIIEEGASQCGFCSPGIVIAMTAYLLTAPAFSKQTAIASVSGNLCRCTGYSSIKRAVLGMERFFPAEDSSARIPPPGEERTHFLVKAGVLPDYFLGIKSQLNWLRAQRPRATSCSASKNSLLVAGGTDFFVQSREEAEMEDLHFLSARAELRGIRRAEGKCLIGAGTTFSELADSPDMLHMIPDIATHFERIASLPIRNRATVGGNIVNGSPIADGTIYLLALDAILHLRHHEERRSVALKDFFIGYKILDLHDGELVESIEFPALKKRTLFNFEKVCQRSHLDIASVNTAISLYLKVPADSLASPDQPSSVASPQGGGMDVTAPQGIIQEVHLSAGGVAPVPLYLQQTVAYLTGKEVTAEVIDRAIEVAKAEISPISDIRGSAAYKRLLLGQLIKAHFAKLLPDNAGGSQ